MTSPHVRLRAWFDAHRVDVLVGLGIFVVVLLAVGWSAQSLGFTRDEGYYFKAGREYWGWFAELGTRLMRGDVLGAFTQEVIDKHWSYNHEHPVLVKTAFALSYGLFKLTAGIFEHSSNAFRFPAWCFAALSAVLVYALARTLKLPRWASLLATGMWVSMPRANWHMHLACFDIPVCAAHLTDRAAPTASASVSEVMT